MSFSSHIERIVNKAHASLSFVKRQCYKTFDPEVAKLLYFDLVRSHLEFASQIWMPYQSSYKQSIESVQRNFVKYIHPNNSANDPTNKHILRPYTTRCTELEIKTLTRRRIDSAIFLLHDIIRGRMKSTYIRNELPFCTITRITRSPQFIRLSRCNNDYTDNSSLRAASRLYNIAALHIDVTLPVTQFRRKISLLPDVVFLNHAKI